MAKDAHSNDGVLTPRELEVSTLIVDGRTNAEIAETLTLSLETVKSHVSHILTKLNVKSRHQLTATLLDQHRSPRD